MEGSSGCVPEPSYSPLSRPVAAKAASHSAAPPHPHLHGRDHTSEREKERETWDLVVNRSRRDADYGVHGAEARDEEGSETEQAVEADPPHLSAGSPCSSTPPVSCGVGVQRRELEEGRTSAW